MFNQCEGEVLEYLLFYWTSNEEKKALRRLQTKRIFDRITDLSFTGLSNIANRYYSPISYDLFSGTSLNHPELTLMRIANFFAKNKVHPNDVPQLEYCESQGVYVDYPSKLFIAYMKYFELYDFSYSLKIGIKTKQSVFYFLRRFERRFGEAYVEWERLLMNFHRINYLNFDKNCIFDKK